MFFKWLKTKSYYEHVKQFPLDVLWIWKFSDAINDIKPHDDTEISRCAGSLTYQTSSYLLCTLGLSIRSWCSLLRPDVMTVSTSLYLWVTLGCSLKVNPDGGLLYQFPPSFSQRWLISFLVVLTVLMFMFTFQIVHSLFVIGYLIWKQGERS